MDPSTMAAAAKWIGDAFSWVNNRLEKVDSIDDIKERVKALKEADEKQNEMLLKLSEVNQQVADSMKGGLDSLRHEMLAKIGESNQQVAEAARTSRTLAIVGLVIGCVALALSIILPIVLRLR